MFLPAVKMAFLLCQTKVKTHAACLHGHLLHSLIICVGVQISLGKMIILSRQACPLNLLLHITQFKHIRNLRDLIFQASRREPWSSGYGRRLRFQRLWVRILAPFTGWTWHFFTLICCKNCNDVCFKRPKINEKEAGVGQLKKLFQVWNQWLGGKFLGLQLQPKMTKYWCTSLTFLLVNVTKTLSSSLRRNL